MSRAVALLLTALTGFSGLVYEVGWQKYLATLLGSHSEATATVLALFLGGLSVGYQLFGRLTRRIVARAEQSGRPPRLLLFYGAVEGGIGAYVLLFPTLFEAIRSLSYAFPHGVGGAGFAVDVALSAILIGPPSILMGGTIPRAHAGALAQPRRRDALPRVRVRVQTRSVRSWGALAAGFYLVPQLGIVHVMYRDGRDQPLGRARVCALIGWRGREVVDLERIAAKRVRRRRVGFASYAAVALLGRPRVMALQTTVYPARRARRSAPRRSRFGRRGRCSCVHRAGQLLAVSRPSQISPPRAGLEPVGARAAPARALPVLPRALLAQRLRAIFRDDDPRSIRTRRSASSRARRDRAARAALGREPAAALPPPAPSGRASRRSRRPLYSWNTVGSLLGALLGGYVLLFWLDLHHDLPDRRRGAARGGGDRLGARRSAPARSSRWSGARSCRRALLCRLGPERSHAGPVPRAPAVRGEVRGADGAAARRSLLGALASSSSTTTIPTTTVSVRATRIPTAAASLSIATGGKIDGDTKGDGQTMRLIAVLPAMMADKLERSFVIGYGTGLTVGELASYPSMREVIVAEISRGVIARAPLFDRVEPARR
jgi:hypothetical protein